MRLELDSCYATVTKVEGLIPVNFASIFFRNLTNRDLAEIEIWVKSSFGKCLRSLELTVAFA